MLAVGLATFILLAAFAVRIASAVQRVKPPSLLTSSATTPTPISAITIRNTNGNTGNNTPIPTYTLGLWPGNYTPTSGSVFPIYGRVLQDTQPIPNISVTISFYGANYSAISNQDGVVTFNVVATGHGPVIVNGVYSINNQTITSATSFDSV